MKKRFALKTGLAAVAGILVGALGMTGFYAYRFGGFDSYPALRKFSQVYNIIDRDYVGDADM